MNVVLSLFLILMSSVVHAADLPKEPGMTKLVLPAVASGHSVKIRYTALLPMTQKLNPGAPSHFSIYEKEKDGWRKVKEFKLSQLFTLDAAITADEEVELASADSEIAVHSTLYHCGKDSKTACYIQAFQGTAKRKSDGVKNLAFTAKASTQY